MKYEITLKQALSLIAIIKAERSEIRSDLLRKYSREIISINGTKCDNEDRIKAGIESFERFEALNKDLLELINAVNVENNRTLSNGKTLYRMINEVKFERMLYDVIRNTMNEPELNESYGNVIEKGCLIQDYLKEKLEEKSLEKIEMLSNEIDILNNETKLEVDLQTIKL